MGSTSPTSIWSTTNFAEAMPGVMTPLGWTVFGPRTELGARAAFRAIGVLRRDETSLPADDTKRFVNIFYGRAAGRADFFFEMGDRMPGASAVSMAQQILGAIPVALHTAPTRRRYPFVAVGFPRNLLSAPSAMGRFRIRMDAHWSARIPAVATMTRGEATAELARSADLFAEAMVHQCRVSLMIVQPILDQLTKVAGDDLFGVLAGQGSHEESALVNDLWACSRGRVDEQTLLGRHGYHGPFEGEICSRVWRESSEPLLRLVKRYAARSDDEDPQLSEMRRRVERKAAVKAMLGPLSAGKRAKARLVLAMADRYMPMRGTGKVAFLQALDLCRASARRLGSCLFAEGLLDDPDDVFYLTLRELVDGVLPPDARDRIAERQRLRKRYLDVDLPSNWIGEPKPVPARQVGDAAGSTATLVGIGVSAGVVEGVARVLIDPTDAEIEDGDVLVARFTDPSWASLMFLSSALVVDIGGLMSHTAVVARELGIPCVVDTKNGTSVLRTGDRVRVDGRTGVVQVLQCREVAEVGSPAAVEV